MPSAVRPVLRPVLRAREPCGERPLTPHCVVALRGARLPQVAKIPEQLPARVGSGGRGMSARVGAAEARLARLEADLAAQFRDIDAGLDALEAVLAVQAASTAFEPANVEEAPDASGLGSPHAASQTPLVAATNRQGHIASGDDRRRLSTRLPAERGAGPPAFRGLASPARAESRAQEVPPLGTAGTDGIMAVGGNTGKGIGRGEGAAEDAGRRLYLTGVRHHACGPVLMTLDIHDLRDTKAENAWEDNMALV